MNRVGIVLTLVITLLCVGMKFNSVAMNNDPALINQLREINTEIEKKEQELKKANRFAELALTRELNALRERQMTIQGKLLKGEAKAPIRESIQSIPAIECATLSKGFIKFLYLKTVKRLTDDDKVISVAFSPDGSKLATGSYTNVAIWDVVKGEKIGLNLQEGRAPVAWSPNGRELATGASNGPLKIWNTVTRAQIGPNLQPGGWLHSVAWSPDGSKLATGAYDRARIWNVATWQELFNLRHSNWVNSVAWSPDGKKLATASWPYPSNNIKNVYLDVALYIVYIPLYALYVGGGARIWDINTGVQIAKLHHDGEIKSIAWSPDGQRVATGGWGKIKIWNPDTGIQMVPDLEHDYETNSVAWSPDGIYLAADGGSGMIKIWNASTGHMDLNLRVSRQINSVAWSPDGSKLAAACDGETILLDMNLHMFLDLTTIDQCELLQAFDMAIQEKGRIQATKEQWHTFRTFPESIQDALRLYIRQATQPAQSASNQVLPIKLPGQFDPNGIFPDGSISSDFIEVAQDDSEPITRKTYEEITSNPHGAILAVVETLAGNKKSYKVYDGPTIKSWLESHPGTDPSNMQPINKITYYITPSASEPFEAIPIGTAHSLATEQYPSAQMVFAFFKAVEGDAAAQRTVGNYYRDKGATRIANEWFRKL